MSRFAVRLLLALVLCLNGFLAPVAMAAHADMTAAVTDKAPPCHGDAAATDTTRAAHADSATNDHDSVPSCCKPGHCVCACVFSLHVPFAPAGVFAGSSETVPLSQAVAMRPARDAVPLRPPIA